MSKTPLAVGFLLVAVALGFALLWKPRPGSRHPLPSTFIELASATVEPSTQSLLKSKIAASTDDAISSDLAASITQLFTLYQQDAESDFVKWVDSHGRTMPPRLADGKERHRFWRIDTGMVRGATLRWSDASAGWLIRNGVDVGETKAKAELAQKRINITWSQVAPERPDHVDPIKERGDMIRISVPGTFHSADGNSKFEGTVFFDFARAKDIAPWSPQKVTIAGWPVGIRAIAPPL